MNLLKYFKSNRLMLYETCIYRVYLYQSNFANPYILVVLLKKQLFNFAVIMLNLNLQFFTILFSRSWVSFIWKCAIHNVWFSFFFSVSSYSKHLNVYWNVCMKSNCQAVLNLTCVSFLKKIRVHKVYKQSNSNFHKYTFIL